MRPNTDVHDYQVRLRAAEKFIAKGNKVKLSLQFRGREMEFRDIGKELMEVREEYVVYTADITVFTTTTEVCQRSGRGSAG